MIDLIKEKYFELISFWFIFCKTKCAQRRSVAFLFIFEIWINHLSQILPRSVFIHFYLLSFKNILFQIFFESAHAKEWNPSQVNCEIKIANNMKYAHFIAEDLWVILRKEKRTFCTLKELYFSCFKTKNILEMFLNAVKMLQKW